MGRSSSIARAPGLAVRPTPPFRFRFGWSQCQGCRCGSLLMDHDGSIPSQCSVLDSPYLSRESVEHIALQKESICKGINKNMLASFKTWYWLANASIYIYIYQAAGAHVHGLSNSIC